MQNYQALSGGISVPGSAAGHDSQKLHLVTFMQNERVVLSLEELAAVDPDGGLLETARLD